MVALNGGRVLRSSGGDHDDRHLRVYLEHLANPLTHLEACHAGHLDVQQNQVRKSALKSAHLLLLLRVQVCQGILAAHRDFDVAEVFERGVDNLLVHLVVVHGKNQGPLLKLELLRGSKLRSDPGRRARRGGGGRRGLRGVELDPGPRMLDGAALSGRDLPLAQGAVAEELDDELRASAKLGLDADAPSVHLGDLCADREPEPDALKSPGVTVLLLLKRLEDRLLPLLGDATPSVDDRYLHNLLVGLVVGRDADETRVRELASIGHQVVDELREFVAVAGDDGQLLPSEVVCEAHGALHERPVHLVHRHIHHDDDLVRNLCEVHRCRGPLNRLACKSFLLRLGQVHDVRHEVEKPRGTTPDHAKLPAHALARRGLQQSRREAKHAVERTSDLVREHRHERRFPLLDHPKLGDLAEVLADAEDAAHQPLLVALGDEGHA
mmetsp:Transcript_54779/g.178012  ORF Transcript_54779/g.178012 Transcript_54779/m.178012 type:complete len:438 (-) Transcript_54779:1418-2731(-)